MVSYPSSNDNESSLWKRIAWNFYLYATSEGKTGLNPPNWNDNDSTLIKKVTYYTATVTVPAPDAPAAGRCYSHEAIPCHINPLPFRLQLHPQEG